MRKWILFVQYIWKLRNILSLTGLTFIVCLMLPKNVIHWYCDTVIRNGPEVYNLLYTLLLCSIGLVIQYPICRTWSSGYDARVQRPGFEFSYPLRIASTFWSDINLWFRLQCDRVGYLFKYGRTADWFSWTFTSKENSL